MSEPRTPREARLAIRELEAQLERVHLAPSSALSTLAGWYLRKARLALRQAERHFAEADDPRLEVLKPLSPHISRDRRQRVRMRCSACWAEQLRFPEDTRGCWQCDAPMERVGRLPAGHRRRTR